MFDALLRRLVGPDLAPLPAPDAELALAALLVRVARSDDSYDAGEAGRINRVLCQRFGLGADDAATLRAKAEALERLAPDTVRFTRALKQATALEDRDSLMQALWSVALQDGHRDAAEDQVLRLISNLLGISDVASALARQRARDGLQ